MTKAFSIDSPTGSPPHAVEHSIRLANGWLYISVISVQSFASPLGRLL